MTRSRGTRTHRDSSTAGGIWTDERSQSVVIGTVLMFALGVALLGLLQVTLIPSANGEVEAEHSQLVRGQMQDLRNDIQRSAGSGQDFSQGVKLGTDYPPRAFFLNPGPAAGSIRTVGTDDGSVDLNITNARAINDETADFWDGTTKDFGTGAIIYRPGYNVYSNAPDNVAIENSLVYSRFDGETLLASDQRFVNGREISLVALDGNLSQSQVNQYTVDTTAVSASTTEIGIENTTDKNITINVSTRLSEETLIQDVLAGQIDDPDGPLDGPETSKTTCGAIDSSTTDDDRYIADCSFSSGTPFNNITLVMEQNEIYRLKLSKVGVGTGATSDGARYVTGVDGDGGTMVDNANREFTFEVRDRFNNPVSGVTLELEAPDDTGNSLTADGNTGNKISATTDENGEVSVVYNPNDVPDDATETRNITADGDFDGDGDTDLDTENANFSIDIVDAEADQNVGSSVNPSGPVVLNDTRVAASQSGGGGMGGGSLDCEDDDSECLVKFELNNTEPLTGNTWLIDELRYHFYIAPLSPGSSNRDAPPSFVEIYDDDGATPCVSEDYGYQKNFQNASSLGPIAPGASEELVLDFNQSVGTNFKSVQGDGIIITIIFQELGNPDNEFSATYYLAPVQDVNYDSNCD